MAGNNIQCDLSYDDWATKSSCPFDEDNNSECYAKYDMYVGDCLLGKPKTTTEVVMVLGTGVLLVVGLRYAFPKHYIAISAGLLIWGMSKNSLAV